VVFDRFLARLFHAHPDDWILKGGFALQLRLGERARTTKDIDLLARNQGMDIHATLQAAGTLDMADHFLFEVGSTAETAVEGKDVLRFNIRCRLADRMFETFHIDVGNGDPVFGEINFVETTDLLVFAGIEPTRVPCYPVIQQIAEKLHAYSQTYGSGGSSRVKDFVDILLLAGLGCFSSIDLRQAIAAAFEHVGKHQVPERLSAPPRNWLPSYRRMAGEVGLEEVPFDTAYARLQKFLDPVLGEYTLVARWNPSRWYWAT